MAGGAESYHDHNFQSSFANAGRGSIPIYDIGELHDDTRKDSLEFRREKPSFRQILVGILQLTHI